MESQPVFMRTNHLDYRKALQFLVILLYYWLLCWDDRTILAPLFGYQGLAYRSAPVWTQACVVGLILVCTALTPLRYRQPSDGVLYVLLPLVVIPVVVIATTDALFANVGTGLVLSVGGAYLLLAVCSKFPRPHGNQVSRLPSQPPWAIVLVLSIASYGLMFATFGVHLRVLTFGDVYSVRSVFTEQAGGPLGYLLEWQANVINPAFIFYGIRSRRKLPLMTGVAGDFLIYTTTGFKSVLFSALAVVVVVLALHRKKSMARPPITGVWLGLAFAVLVAVSYLLDLIGHSAAWSSLFAMRLSLVPGVNTGFYFQFFSVAPKTHLAYGVAGTFLGTHHAVPPPRQIALSVYHMTVRDPNANIWADAYANFGYAGVAAFTLVLAAFLWLYDRVAWNVDKSAAMVMITIPGLALVNAALFTSLLTHGMLLALFVVTRWSRVARAPDEFSSRRAVPLSSSSVWH